MKEQLLLLCSRIYFDEFIDIMGYTYSHLDKSLKRWFQNDVTSGSLQKIELFGEIRSLNNVTVSFDFPITAFAGKNGCGKTTMLALAACAYHNIKSGFSFKEKKKSYLTFSDFFIQTSEELKPTGLEVHYTFLSDKWSNLPEGLGRQVMKKRKEGKWSKYENRIDKNVIYLGIERVVPQTERQVFKSYKKYFRDGIDGGWYKAVQNHVGYVLGKSYSDFKIKNVRSYKLHQVKEREIVYSGFNMGAGEKALFELFSMIYECSSKSEALIIIDEIELGLHEIAQRRLVQVLKEICQKQRLQIICTTHSPTILESLPPEARFYISKTGKDCTITKGISGAFAAGRLAENHSDELDIYVEDETAKLLLKSSFDTELRQRVGILPVGSSSAVCRQLILAYKHPKLRNKSIVVLDGDQRIELSKLVDRLLPFAELSTDAEKSKFRAWAVERICFLPGSVSPEKWIIEKSITHADSVFANQIGVGLKTLRHELNLALSQPSHDEIFYLANKLSLEADYLLNDLCRLAAKSEKGSFKNIHEKVMGYLES